MHGGWIIPLSRRSSSPHCGCVGAVLQRDKEDSEAVAFEVFILQGGESLLHQGIFDALHAWFVGQDQPVTAGIPGPLRINSRTAPPCTFRIEHGDEIRFYQWLQWLAARQFAACWRDSQRLQMTLGLYRDLAVGVAANGAETRSQRALYCLAASVGAPPDILGPLGQNWGLPPLHRGIV